MCGIAGILDYSGASNDLVLEQMRDSLVHRGPDNGNQSSWKGACFLGLAHRRLAIIDPSDSGNQPMHFKHLSVVFNGEIYNFKAIKKELLLCGHSFETASDTEVLLHAFYEWNLDAVNRFKGMFALALVNHQSQQLYLFRDRFGVKPLYYFHKDKTFLFASELKAFHGHPAFKKELNQASVAHFFLFGNVPAPESIFENTFKLMPGSCLRVNILDLTFSNHTYWYPKATEEIMPAIHFDEAKIRVKSLLEASVIQRTVSDVPLGLFLSGGYDSATVAGILTQHTGSLKTFTVSVPDIGLDEGPKARQIANHLGTDHTEIECSADEARRVIPKLPSIYDEPFSDSSAIPTYLVAKETVKSVKVALSADGGDEFFGGYNRYRYYYKIPSWINRLPTALGRGVEATVGALNLKNLKAQRVAKFSRLIGNFSLETYMKAMTYSVSEEFIHQLLREPHRVKGLPFVESHSPISTLMLNDTVNYLPNDILHKVDRATMAVGLESREPFLDDELYLALAQLPDAFKCTARASKILLKDIAHQYIPPGILSGPKKGFAIPINDWMRQYLQQELRYFSSLEFLNKQRLFHAEFANKQVQQFLRGNDAMALFVWYFYSFQSWYEEWM